VLSAAVYSFGFSIQRAIGLVMLPLYTRVIAPSQYGALGVLVAAAAVVYIAYSLGLDSALLRNYFQFGDDAEGRQEYIDSLWRFTVFYPLAATAALTGIAWLLLPSIKNVSILDVLFMLTSTAAATASATIPLTLLRARQDLRRYTILTSVVTVGTPLLTALFVVVLKTGIMGWFIGSTISCTATFVVAVRLIPWHVGGRIRGPVLKSAILFSAPLLPHLVSGLALQLADRGVIATIVSSKNLGTYTLASNLSAPLMLVVGALYQGFAPAYARAGADPNVSDELSRTVVAQVAAVITLTLAGILLGPSMVDILTPASYHPAAPLTPWIMLGYGFMGVYYVPMSGALLGAGRSRFVWVASGASALTNIALLLIFVPTYGITAAAVASAAGYAALLALIVVWAHARPNPVRYEWGRLSVILIAGVLAWLGSRATNSGGSVEIVLVNLGWLCAFVLGVVAVVFRAELFVRIRRVLA
jgi:O-antigen/teichoic acid export membrane protein